MRRKGSILLLGLIVIVSGWWIMQRSSSAQPEEGVVDVWTTWGDDPAQLQALLDRHSQFTSIPVRVTARVRSDDLLEALASTEPPDLVILSSADLVKAYSQQGLVEPLDGWIQASNIDLNDIYPASLAQCRGHDGTTLCLPWGSDIDALFWNKELFAAAGLDPERPPQTMEELLDYARKLSVRDEEGRLSQVGFIPNLPQSYADLYVRMFGGAFYREGGHELAANSRPVVDAMNWQQQFYAIGAPEELQDFVSSFTPYMTSRHPLYAGKQLSCQQCHRSSPIQNGKTPDTGFVEGKIAMMLGGQWLLGAGALPREGFQVSYGVAPFPPPATHPERTETAIVRGPVVIVPSGALDSEAAVQLLAWMTSPEIVAEAAYAHALLPTSRTAAQDPRFRQNRDFEGFLGLLDHPNAKPAVTTPIGSELNKALHRVEAELLIEGGDPASLLNDVQAELAPKLAKGLSSPDGQ